MTEHYVGVDVHKTKSQVAVIDDNGEIEEEVRVKNANLDEIAQKYAGGEAALEATSNYFTIYDTLDEYLDVTLANPLKANWLANQKQKNDRVDAKKLARFLRMDEVPESYVPPEELRKYRALARGRKKLTNKKNDFQNEVHALLDQQGITHTGSLWSDEGREFLAELTLEEPWQFLLDQWLEAIDEFDMKITRSQRKIETIAKELEEMDILTSVPGIAAYSGLMIYGEIGEIDRFDRANELVSYAGLDPVVRESGDSRTEGSISKQCNKYLRWILGQAAKTAVHNCKDPYLSEFYWRLRDGKNKPAKVALVATARKLLVSLYHMLTNEEVYDPPEVSA
ncbi:IS110 family transposase [Halococcus thailandensis]|uniref:IS110 family transposase n=1 Tax=Halococcus thailandensis TaxID=335952 RepID=UPI0009B5AF37|nr:IS110 family transposase [Halococcus thailandensis]